MRDASATDWSLFALALVAAIRVFVGGGTMMLALVLVLFVLFVGMAVRERVARRRHQGAPPPPS